MRCCVGNYCVTTPGACLSLLTSFKRHLGECRHTTVMIVIVLHRFQAGLLHTVYCSTNLRGLYIEYIILLELCHH